jgi:hypothetical protein
MTATSLGQPRHLNAAHGHPFSTYPGTCLGYAIQGTGAAAGLAAERLTSVDLRGSAYDKVPVSWSAYPASMHVFELMVTVDNSPGVFRVYRTACRRSCIVPSTAENCSSPSSPWMR